MCGVGSRCCFGGDTLIGSEGAVPGYYSNHEVGYD